MATGNVTAPIASSAASLGITPRTAVPAVGGPAAASPNARAATSFSSTPAPVSGGGPSLTDAIGAVANQNSAASSAATAAVASQFGAPLANDFAAAARGGPINDALQNGVAKIAAFAQNGIKGIEKAIEADMKANNGQVDPAKMQQYTMQMSTFELIMQMAAKIQEKQERAAQIWLQ